MTRFGAHGQVHLWEEPVFEPRERPSVAIDSATPGVTVITPVLPPDLSAAEIASAQRELLDTYLKQAQLQDIVAWYYTPMALQFSDHLAFAVTVYDCMDQLSAFQGAPPELVSLESRLFEKADVVFAGGASLYASKREQHSNVHLFPSSIDYNHFAAARQPLDEPADQRHIPHPRIGFFGVLDERLDRDLLRDLAALHPEWHFILIGPVVKIRHEDLPQAPNLHYLGQKQYSELPAYLAHWDVAMLPFARNLPPGLSVRQKRRSTWQPAGQSSQRPFRMSSIPMERWASYELAKPRKSFPMPSPPVCATAAQSGSRGWIDSSREIPGIKRLKQ